MLEMVTIHLKWNSKTSITVAIYSCSFVIFTVARLKDYEKRNGKNVSLRRRFFLE
jgi:hypothetical protein